jgi:hypothetical protein
MTSSREHGSNEIPAVYAKNRLVIAFIGVMDHGDLIRSQDVSPAPG